MKLLDLLNEGPNDMNKDQKVKRAIVFYRANRIGMTKVKFDFGEMTFKVELPHLDETSFDWSHNGDVLINIKGEIKVYYPFDFDGEKYKYQIFNTVKDFFTKKRIHLNTLMGRGIYAVRVKNQINESMEGDKLIKKALEVYKFLRKGMINYEYDLKGPGLSYGRRKGSIKVTYELPPVENVNVEIHQELKKPMITFRDNVIYKVVKGERFDRFDEDDLEHGDLLEDIKKRFVKYNILLIDLNYGDFESQMLDYENPDDEEEF